jgi:hypothetical protein
MGTVIILAEWRYKRHRKKVAVGGIHTVINFKKVVDARKRTQLFAEYSDALAQVEYQCIRLIRKRRSNAPYSESLAYRAATILSEYNADVALYLREHNPAAQTLHYFGAIDYCTGQLFETLKELRSLPQVYTLEVSDAVRDLDFRIAELRYALEHVFTEEGKTLSKTAYTL